jgi:hypothetical protein
MVPYRLVEESAMSEAVAVPSAPAVPVALPQNFYNLVASHPVEVGGVLAAIQSQQLPDPAHLTTLGAALGIDLTGVTMNPNLLMGLSQMMGGGMGGMPMMPGAAPAPAPNGHAPRAAAPPGGGGTGHPLGIGPRIDDQGRNIAEPAPAPVARRQPAAAQAAPAASGIRPTGRGRAEREAEPEEMPVDEAFNVYGQMLVALFREHLPDVAFSFEYDPAEKSWRVSASLPGDEEDTEDDVLSEVLAPARQLGDGLGHVFQEAQRVMQGDEG